MSSAGFLLTVVKTGRTSSFLSELFTMESLTERIILAVDITEEMSELFTKTRTKLQIITQALKMFVSLKSSALMNSHLAKNEFAIILLTPTGPQWMIDFTSNSEYILSAIDGLTPVAAGESNGGQAEPLDMSQLLQLVLENFHPKDTSKISFCRVLCVFGRSNVVPVYSMGRAAHAELLQHAAFGFDVIYLHQKPAENNKVRDIFDSLGQTDVADSNKCPNFLFARHRRSQDVTRDVACLAQHPGLRKPQPKNFDEMKEMLRYRVPVTVPSVGGDAPSFLSPPEVPQQQQQQQQEFVVEVQESAIVVVQDGGDDNTSDSSSAVIQAEVVQ